MDEAIRAIFTNPEMGDMKKGDLASVRVYKYRFQEQFVLLAYRVVSDEDTIKLLAFGVYENFYRDLKREIEI